MIIFSFLKRQNHFLLKKMLLNIELKKNYNEVAPHSVYNKIPSIPFSAIISCSPDIFLKKAFKENNLDSNFHYYSQKGATNENVNTDKSVSFLYNVFGYLNDEDSLITTYESFYKFIISIMGEEQQLPLELRNRIVDSKIFLFMGFDLTKWYVPLLIHKLNSYKQDQKDTDATALINNDNTFNENTEQHFPLEMIVLNGDSIPTIDAIFQKLQKKGNLRKKSQVQGFANTDDLIQLVRDNNISEALDKLKKANEDKDIDNMEVFVIEARFNQMEKNTRLGTTSEAGARLERAKIINALLELIDLLK